MSQLILAKSRDDGDYEFIAAIQNDADSTDVPALEWILQMKEYLEHDDTSISLIILLRDEIPEVLEIVDADDISKKCEVQFKAGNSFYE